jgi:hypothetical protein
MEASETFFDTEPSPFQSNLALMPISSFVKRKDELVAPVFMVSQFKERKTCGRLRGLSNEGFVQMAPGVDDIGSYSLSLTRQGEAFLESLQSKLQSTKEHVIYRVTDFALKG